MSKYVIRNCPNSTTSYYGTGEIIHNQCGLTDDSMCKDINNCFLKQIYDIASSDVVDNNFEEPLNKILFKFDITEIEEVDEM